jgi:hypothetical protein
LAAIYYGAVTVVILRSTIDDLYRARRGG